MDVNLSKNLKERLSLFFENHPPEQFSKSLRKMLLEYIRKQSKVGFYVDFSDFISALEDLFDLLDLAAEEIEE